MKLILKLLLICLATACMTTCKEKEEANDPATLVSGNYTGEYKYSGSDDRFAADVMIERVNDTTIYLSAFIEGHSGYSRKVYVQALDDGSFELHYTTGMLTSSLGGTVTGNRLEYMYNFSEFFWGDKPISQE